MKLTIDRKESTTGIVFKKPSYALVVTVDVTPEEYALIKKHKWHEEWDGEPGQVGSFRVGFLIQKPGSTVWNPEFGNVGALAHYEARVIDALKSIKQRLEAVEGYTTNGPQEIEL